MENAISWEIISLFASYASSLQESMIEMKMFCSRMNAGNTIVELTFFDAKNYSVSLFKINEQTWDNDIESLKKWIEKVTTD